MKAILQLLYLKAEDVPKLPRRWTAAQVNEIADVLKPGKLYDENNVFTEGDVPVVNQSADEFHGFHSDEPGVLASEEQPVSTFANHTCAMRLMKRPFSCIQNIFPRIGKPGFCDTVFFHYATLGRLAISGYKGHHPIYREAWIPFPPLSQQIKIGQTIAAYDDLIENNRRRMELLEESARLLYREWFVRLRFPGHEHTQIKNGIPEGWEKKRLDAIAEVNRASLSNGYDGEIEYVDISSVVPGQITETTTLAFKDAPSRARRIVQHGDIIWSCVRPNRRSHAIIWNPADNLIVSTGFAVITPTGTSSTFLYFATTTDAFVGYLENHARGAAYPAVVAADFERAEILVPPQRLLGLFDELAEPMFSQMHNLRQQNQKLRTARDLLLPRLMSGEIEV